MKIGIIGSGTVGSVVGPRWASKGHAILYGSRDPAGDKMTALLDKIGSNGKAVELKDVATGCDAVLLPKTLPAQAALEARRAVRAILVLGVSTTTCLPRSLRPHNSRRH